MHQRLGVNTFDGSANSQRVVIGPSHQIRLPRDGFDRGLAIWRRVADIAHAWSSHIIEPGADRHNHGLGVAYRKGHLYGISDGGVAAQIQHIQIVRLGNNRRRAPFLSPARCRARRESPWP